MHKPIYVVVGMHRSGTSAVARGLMTLGISLGDKLMPAVPDNNETGFWEDMDICALNEKVLEALGESVNSVRLFDERKLDQALFRDLEERARALLSGKLATFGTYGFKDPRTSRLLPFWQRVFRDLALDPGYVVVTRHPISVAQSLQKRDGLSVEQSHVLWLEHMLPSLHRTANCRRVVVDYDKLMEDPAREIERMRAALRVPRPAGMKKRLADYAANFLTERLRHSHFDARALREAPGMPASAVRLHQLLVRLASDEISPDDEACTAEVRRLWSAMEDIAPAFSLAQQLLDRIADRDASLARLGSDLSARAGQVAALEGAIGERDLQLRLAASESVEREHRFAAEGASREQRIATLEATIMARDAELHRAGTDASLREQRAANLESLLAERDARMAVLSGDVEAAARRMADLETEYLQLRHDTAGRERSLNREKTRADELAQELESVSRSVESERDRADRLAQELASVSLALAKEREHAASVERFFAEAKSSLDEQTERAAALDALALDLGARLHEQTFRLDSIEGSSFWRASAPLRRAWNFLEPLITQHRNFAFRLIPNADLQRVGTLNVWHSTGGDPHFHLVPAEGRYPGGWALLRTSMSCERETPWAKLYVDAGDGMPEDTAIRVYHAKGGGSVSQIVRLPPKVVGLRWDPMDGPGQLIQRPVILAEVGPVARRIHMLARVYEVMRGGPSGALARHGLTWGRVLTDLDGAYRASSELLGGHPVQAIAH